MFTISFSDKTVSYETFVNDVSARIVAMLKTSEGEPEYLSQKKAFEKFGRANVERWRRTGLVEPRKRPGRLEYPTATLRMLQNTVQDYF